MNSFPEFFQEHRLLKRENLLKEGVNPYPYSFSTTHTIPELMAGFEKFAAEESIVSCAGRMLSARKMGKSWFLDIIDKGNRFQLYVRKEESSEETVNLVPNLDIGDWLGVTGRLFRTRTGEPTLVVKKLEILGKSVADVPFGKIHDGVATYALSNIEVRRQQRYLDWITDPDSVKRFELRSRIISLIRRYLEDQGFLEVQTPTLELVYGGGGSPSFYHNGLGAQRADHVSPGVSGAPAQTVHYRRIFEGIRAELLFPERGN